jgi:CheY-like chemotaxis protein
MTEQRISNEKPEAAGKITVVGLMSRDDDDGRLLAEIGGRRGWQVVFAETHAEAEAALDQAQVPVVFCDHGLLGLGWRRAVERLSGPPKRACVILLSETADTNLRNEVVGGGGYDVLPKPLREETVTRTVRLARSYWISPARTGLLMNGPPELAKEGRS